MERVFVSHSHADNRIVATFVRDLRAAGVDVWVDLQEITHGLFQASIDAALLECSWFVLIMTSHSLTSKWVINETYAAVRQVHNNRMQDIVPIVGGSFDEQIVLPTLSGYHRQDPMREGYTAAFQGLLKALHRQVVIPLSIRELGHDVKGIPEASDAIIQEVKLRNLHNQPVDSSLAQQPPPTASITAANQQAQEVHELVNDGRWLTAITIAEDAIQRSENQQNASLWGDYGLALIRTDGQKKGLDMLTKALQLADDRADLWVLKAQTLAAEGDLPGAIVAWKTAFTRSKTSAERLAILADQYHAQMKAKDLSGARQTCQLAGELAPNNPDWQQRVKEVEVLVIAEKEAAQRKQREEEQRRRQQAEAEQLARILPTALQAKGFTLQTNNGTEIIIPPMCTVAKRPFLMGSDKSKDSRARENELPQHSVTLEEYAIGTYPLTVAEYVCFVRATKRSEPQNWQTQMQKLDHPVVNVSWNDMLAYVQWLAQVTGQPYRMPTEAEWEKAARGTDGRIYPWGNQWDKTRANTDDGGPSGTTPVGSYPQGASPYGCMDMAGNVLEWTSTIHMKYPYKNDINHENNNSTNNRVLRGGSWLNYPEYARAAYRNFSTPGNFNFDWGGRVARARLSAGS